MTHYERARALRDCAYPLSIPLLAEVFNEVEVETKKKCDLENPEKLLRIYYQSIVYDVCNIIDRHRGDGKQTVCGTTTEPFNDVQYTLSALLSNMEPKL